MTEKETMEPFTVLFDKKTFEYQRYILNIPESIRQLTVLKRFFVQKLTETKKEL